MAYFKKNWPENLHAEVLACAKKVVGQVVHVKNPTEQGNSSTTACHQEEQNRWSQETYP